MATVLPDNPASQIPFFQSRVGEWAVDPAAVGLTDEQVAEVAAATAAAAEANQAAYAARQAAKAATLRWELAAAETSKVGRNAISTIKAYAQKTDDPGVYSASGIDAPGRPGPKRRDQDEQNAAVPRVRNVTLAPDALGNVELRWTCGQGATMGAGAGMFYRIQRSVNEGEMRLLDVVGGPGAGRRSNRYLDTSIPEGARTATYQIIPMRGTATGAASLTVHATFAGVATTRRASELRWAA